MPYFSIIRVTSLCALTLIAIHTRAEEPLSYNRDIRPILSNNCFFCHGFDKNARKADLRLDIREEALAAKAFVPGDIEASELAKRIASNDPDEVMPPPKSERVLKPAERELLKRWIAEGAAYETHWAYAPVKRPVVPAANGQWPRNSVDHFVARQHEIRGLTPSKEADRRTLIRRLSFDLVGLPPTPEEVEAFMADDSPAAYEKVVDRLLASPHYGERMAMDWLDQVRYADTNGFHGDQYRSVWPYRDYVIRAFNANMPFDQFTTEQLAGDLLPDATQDQKVAASFNRLNQLTAEGGAQPKEYLHKYMADRVRTVASVWMGATMGCTECHDHKYDPITAKDFYSMGAFFADITEKGVYSAGDDWYPMMPLPSDDQAARQASLIADIARLEAALATTTPDLQTAQRGWEEETRQALLSEQDMWAVQPPDTFSSANGTEFKKLKDDSLLTEGPNPAKETYTLRLLPGAMVVKGLRLEALPHRTFPRGLARANGNFVLTEVEVLYQAPGQEQATPIKIASAQASYAQEGHAIETAFDGNAATGWAVSGHERDGARTAVFTFEGPTAVVEDGVIIVHLRHDSQFAQHAIGRFRLSLTDADAPALGLRFALSDEAFEALKTIDLFRTQEQRDALAAHYRTVAPSLDDERADLAKAQGERSALESEIPKILATVAEENPREIRVLARGNFLDESGEIVSPSVPAVFGSLATGERRATRLDLAKWLVSSDNPLTARVVMNRTWRLFFGTGLSKVVDDFGMQGEWPTHLDLLDWLAAEFMESGWDMKHMVKTMVMSATYRQDSHPRPELTERDPYNRFLARQSRQRMQAEIVRDNALAVSGLLSEKLLGPSVYPYQPEGYYANTNTFTGPLLYDTSKDEDQYRRGLYTIWKRSFLHPSMLAFDAPTREECTAQRTVSNTPLQALVLLNDPTYVEAARTLAERTLRAETSDDAQRLAVAFGYALQRAPVEKENETLLSLLDTHRAKFAAHSDAATALLSIGQHPAPEDLDPIELAAWTSVVRAILNLHEVITKA